MRFTKSFIFLIAFFMAAVSCQKEDPKPSATAEFSSTQLSEGLVAFFNTSKNATSHKWKFGDGGVSTEIAPNHKYSANGSYTVELIAKGPGGESTITQKVDVTNVNPFLGSWKMVSTARTGCLTPSNNKPDVNCGGTDPNAIVCATITFTTRALVSDWWASWAYTRTGNVLQANQNNGITYTLLDNNLMQSTEASNFNGCVDVVNYVRL